MSPAEIRLAKSRTYLQIRWPDGATQLVTAAILRAHCRSATAIRDGVDAAEPSAFGAVRIAGIAPVGGYAVNIAFSDGEARGIYPWPLLRSMGR